MQGTFVHASQFGSYTTDCEVVEDKGDRYVIRFYDSYASEDVYHTIKKSEFTLNTEKQLVFYVVKHPGGSYNTQTKTGSSAPALYNSEAKARAKAWVKGSVIKRWIIQEHDL